MTLTEKKIIRRQIEICDEMVKSCNNPNVVLLGGATKENSEKYAKELKGALIALLNEVDRLQAELKKLNYKLSEIGNILSRKEMQRPGQVIANGTRRG